MYLRARACFVCVSAGCVTVESTRGGAAVRLQGEPGVRGPRETAGEGGRLLQGRGLQGSDGGGATPRHPARGGDRKERQGQKDC